MSESALPLISSVVGAISSHVMLVGSLASCSNVVAGLPKCRLCS